MKSINNILVALCLLIAGTGCLSAGTPKKVHVDKYGVKESASAELLSRKKQEDGKLTFKCRIVRYEDDYTLLACILKNDSSVYVVKPGIKLLFAEGDSVVLKPERDAACCSNWANGRWYNVAFKLGKQDVEKLKSREIHALYIPSRKGDIHRSIIQKKRNAVAELLRSLENE